MRRHFIEARKAPVVDLLLAARAVEFNNFDEFRVGEVRYGRVVEGEVRVLADARTDEVGGTLLEYPRIPLTLCLQILSIALQKINTLKRNVVEQVFT